MASVAPVAGALAQAARPSRPASARAFPPFAAATIALAIALVAAVAPTAGAPLDEPAFWVVAAAVVAGELLPIRLPRRDDLEEIALSAPFAFALLMVAGPLPAIAVYVGSGLLHDVLDRTSPLKTAFNAAQYALSLLAGAAVLALAGVPPGPGEAYLDGHLPAVLGACVAVFAVNQALVGIGTALVTGAPPRDLVLGDLPFQGWTAGFVLSLAPLVLAAAERQVALVALLFFPVLAIRIGGREAVLNAHRALHDELTGLPNRALLADRLSAAIRHAERHDEHVALAIVDLNAFKAVNDTLGHDEGDRLLQQVANRLASARSEGMTLARLGGDEFAVVLPGAGAAAGAAAVAELLVQLQTPFALDGLALHVDARCGLAVAPQHGRHAHELLKHADVALSAAKASHTELEVYDVDEDEHSLDRLALAAQLARGIDRGEIVVHFQPKLALTPGRRHGVEALVRWEHPQLGLIGPGGFVPLAEQSSLLKPLTARVLDDALCQRRAWQDADLDVRVSVNVSARTLLDRRLPAEVASALHRWGVPADGLQIEITESRIVAEDPRAECVLGDLRELGVGLAIDDFGTGFSSLAQLQRLPVDEIKIDKSFVLNMGSSPDDAAIVRSTIELARSLDLDVTAEGVETPEAYETLVALGCDSAQGFHLGRPSPADACERDLRRFPRPDRAPDDA